MFDVNPTPEGDSLSLNVNMDDSRLDLSLALEVATFFGLDEDEAQTISSDCLRTVGQSWRSIAEKCGLSKHAQTAMEPAFSLCL